jgi:hypothetical protein
MEAFYRILNQSLRLNQTELQRSEMLRDQLLIIASTIHLA